MIPIRYADIDLSTGQVRDYPLSEEAIRMYLGGKGLAAYILYKELAPGIDPLSPDNILIINTTPLTGTGAPCTSRFNATSKMSLPAESLLPTAEEPLASSFAEPAMTA